MSTSAVKKVKRSTSVPDFSPQLTGMKEKKRKYKKQNSIDSNSFGDRSSTTSESSQNVSIVHTGSCKEAHSGKEALHMTVSIDAEKVQNLLFSKSQWLEDFYQERGYTNIKLGEWEDNNGEKKRVNTYTMPVKNPVAKTAHVTENVNVTSSHNPPSVYSYMYDVVNAGIPYQDAFSVSLHQCVTQTKPNQCLLHVDAEVKYKKSLLGFIKSMIEKGTLNGLDDYYTDLRPALESYATGKTVSETVTDSPKPVAIKQQPLKQEIPQTESSSWTNLLVFGSLILLTLFNLYLYWKIRTLQSPESHDTAEDIDLSGLFLTISSSPDSKEEWQALIEKLQNTHSTEIGVWRQFMISIVKQLRQTEQDIINLLENIVTYETHTMLGELKNS